MNRYDTASVAKFNPLSFQEIMAAPLAMRQKHDNSIAAAEAMRIKANPLDKHLARALEIKNQMDTEIANNVDTLNKEGYNPTTFQNITKLNRQYQDYISPTGEIGQINAAKTIYDTNQEEFIKDAAKQNIGRDQAIKKWQEKTAYYTGFDDDGKSITNVSPQGVAAYQDYEKYKQVAKSLMGEVESESHSGGYKLVPSSLNNGTMVMVDSKGFQKKSTNLDALNNAIIAGSEMWLKPTGEGYKYNQDAGVDQNNFRQRFAGDFSSMLKTSKGNGYEENGSFINDASGPNSPKQDPNAYPDSIPEKINTISNNENLIKDLKNFKPNTLIPYNAIPIDPKDTSENKAFIRKQNEINRFNNTYEKKLNSNSEYIDLATKIINQSPSLKGLSTSNQKVVNATMNYLNNHKNTQIVNRIITPTTSKDTRGYSADEISKYTKMKQDAMETSIRNGMKVYDENGDEIEKPNSKSIIYNGEYTFNSITPIKSTNPKTKFSPISATMVDKDGNEQKVYVAQNPDREREPLFKAQYTAFQTLDKANKYRGLKQPLKNTFTEENLGLRDVNVTYNDDGSVILEGKHYNGKNWEEMPKQIYGNDSDFVNYIHNLYK